MVRLVDLRFQTGAMLEPSFLERRLELLSDYLVPVIYRTARRRPKRVSTRSRSTAAVHVMVLSRSADDMASSIPGR